MTGNKGKKIIIVEDAKGIARGYKTILERAGYDVIVCLNGKEAQSLIDEDRKFDIAIMDIMLPPENLDKYTLAECQGTGLRFVEQMIKKSMCHRFYVITVLRDVRDRLEKICNGKAVYKYEDKISHEPEKLVKNIAELLATGIPK